MSVEKIDEEMRIEADGSTFTFFEIFTFQSFSFFVVSLLNDLRFTLQ